MKTKNNTNLIGGILLILLGVSFFVIRLWPIPDEWIGFFTGWPMILVGVGIALFVLGLLLSSPEMAVPASIVTGLGGIFLYQNKTNDWGSWSYIWSLIPGFVGIGLILSGLIKWQLRSEMREGFRLILISAVLFVIFGSFLGGLSILGNYWPIFLILLGIWMIVRNLVKK